MLTTLAIVASMLPAPTATRESAAYIEVLHADYITVFPEPLRVIQGEALVNPEVVFQGAVISEAEEVLTVVYANEYGAILLGVDTARDYTLTATRFIGEEPEGDIEWPREVITIELPRTRAHIVEHNLRIIAAAQAEIAAMDPPFSFFEQALVLETITKAEAEFGQGVAP